MVFFTCSSCGASLKKNQVEKHYLSKCRNCEYVTCIDCLKDFPGDDYKQHVKCISEDERYGGKNWTPKASANKGEKKQIEWVENLQTLVASNPDLDPDVRTLLKTVMNFENIPRKRQKFINFVKNISRGTRPATVDKTWDLFECALKKPNDEKPKKAEEVNGDSSQVRSLSEKKDDNKVEKNKKKRKKGKEDAEEEETETKYGLKRFKGTSEVEYKEEAEECAKRKTEDEEVSKENNGKIPTKSGKFDWEETIEKCLKKNGGNMPFKRLKKKVIREFMTHHNDTHKSKDELSAKLLKKVSKNKKFKFLKDVVSLH